MKVMVVGGGGREHAIVWKLNNSGHEVFCAPGNPGIADIAECIEISEMEFDDLANFAESNQIDLTFVGPEAPLTAGIVDFFEERGLNIFGPNRFSAQLEGSKIYAKQVMERFDVPTAEYKEFDDFEQAVSYVKKQGVPIVIKADGLAAGKGVTVAETLDDAIAALKASMVDKIFGEGGNKVVVEECLLGQEMTVLAFVDGATVLPMVPSQDHKPIFDGDLGPNTGGMGAYTPVPHLEHWLPDVEKQVLQPVAEGLAKEGTPFRGILYAGLMITKSGLKVIEFNVRFGDPETQVLLPCLKNDLAEIFMAATKGRLHEQVLAWNEGASVCVVAAAPGYPGPPIKGIPIKLPENYSVETQIFQAGTIVLNGQLVSNGGRVLAVSAQGADISDAREKAYGLMKDVNFKDKFCRTDIGVKALK